MLQSINLAANQMAQLCISQCWDQSSEFSVCIQVSNSESSRPMVNADACALNFTIFVFINGTAYLVDNSLNKTSEFHLLVHMSGPNEDLRTRLANS